MSELMTADPPPPPGISKGEISRMSSFSQQKRVCKLMYALGSVVGF